LTVKLIIRNKFQTFSRELRAGSGLLLTLLLLAVINGSLQVLAESEASFERLGPYGGTVRSLLISSRNSRIVYLGTSDGQLFKSSDGGSSWNLVYPGLGVRRLVIDTIVEDPSDGDHLFIGGWDLRTDGGGLFESRDAGRSWNQVPLSKASVAVRGFAISKENPSYMIAGTLAGVFLSSDSGRNWRQSGIGMEAFSQVESVAIDPVDPRILLVGTWHLGYRSRDFGKTWIQNDRGMIHDSDVFSISIDERNPKNIFASACTGLYRSIDQGVSWTRLKVFPKTYLVRAQVVYIDPGDSLRVYGGTTEGLFVSRNSGQTWSRITRPDLSVNAIQVDPADNRIILLGTEIRGVLRSEDGGSTWAEANAGFVNRSIARIVADPSIPGRLLIGEYSEGRIGGYHAYETTGNQWVRIPEKEIPGEGMLALLVLPGDRGRIAGTARGAFLQRPGARDWICLPGPISKLNVCDLSLDRNGTWIFAGTNDGIYRTRLEDLAFQKPTGYRLIPRVFSLLASRNGPDRILAGTHMGVLGSDDSGATWNILSGGIPNYALVHCLAASPTVEGRLFAGTTAGLYESRNGGNSWKPMLDGRLGVDISSVSFLDASGMRIVAADNSQGGVFLSEDGGVRWAKIANPEFSSPVRFLSPDPLQPSTVYLGTGTEGVYRLRLQAPDCQVPSRGPKTGPEDQPAIPGR
jgi:photosystem II stability/assembly factor-like uncharacterized protein